MKAGWNDGTGWDVYSETGSASREAYKLAHRMASQDAIRWKQDLERAHDRIETLEACLDRLWKLGVVPADEDIWDEVVDALRLVNPTEEE